MIDEIEFGYIRSFASPQRLAFSKPTKLAGSGYNVIVGKNNSGKTTIFRHLRELLSNYKTITIGSEARHDPSRPHISVKWLLAEMVTPIGIEHSSSGGLFRKSGEYTQAETGFRYVPSRRPFGSEFNSTHELANVDYERHDFINRRQTPSYYDSMLATSLAPILMDGEKKKSFLDLLNRLDRRITDIDADNIGGKDVIRFCGASGRWHPISDTGDGITNSIRIVHALIGDGNCIVVDEPELSLHPQFQRNLYELLIEASSNKQIIVLTHSPHFVSWRNISKAGSLSRVFLNEVGFSEVRQSTRSALQNVAKFADGNVTSRKYYDAVCKELFFSDEAILVEGADDVHYISNYLETKGEQALPLMGYGCGGAEAIGAWANLCSQLGIKVVSLFDGDKKNEFEKTLIDFESAGMLATSFLLGRDDIRDKYSRDHRGRETNDVLKPGIFRRDGSIHPEVTESFERLISSVRLWLLPQ